MDPEDQDVASLKCNASYTRYRKVSAAAAMHSYICSIECKGDRAVRIG